MESAFKSRLFRPRKSEGCAKRRAKVACDCQKTGGEGERCDVIYVTAGMECPFCGMGTLKEESPGKVVCPICGYGTNRPVT